MPPGRAAAPTPRILLVLLAVATAGWGLSGFFGTEIQVNQTTPGNQRPTSMLLTSDGKVWIAWGSDSSSGTDTDLESVQARLFDSGLAPLTDEFQVNVYTTGRQRDSTLAELSDGRILVVWSSFGSDGGDVDDYSIQGRFYLASGQPAGDQFQVNAYTTSAQYLPSVAATPDGGFVVLYSSRGSFGDDPDESIQARIFDAAGAPLGPEFQVNTNTTELLFYSGDVEVAPDGTLLAVWEASSRRIKTRAFDPAGVPLGDEVRIDPLPGGFWRITPDLALDARGDGFVVVWEQYEDGPQYDPLGRIATRRVSTEGQPLGDRFLIGFEEDEINRGPRIDADPDGGFAVAWGHWNLDPGETSDILIQFVDDFGAPTHAPFVVNQFTPGFQLSPTPVVSATDFRVVWSSGQSPGDPDGTSVRAVVGARGIFADGFESGDTSAWSATVP
jgi:hypothetical protein